MAEGDNDTEWVTDSDVRAWPPPHPDVLHFAQRALLDADGTAMVIIGFDGGT